MQFQSTPFTLPLLLSLAITVIVIAIAWRRRALPAVKTFLLMIASIVVWLIGYTVRWAGADLATQLLGLRVVYIGLALVPVAYLVFALDYTGKHAWINRRVIALLCIVPVVTIALTWTNDWHHWFWKSLWQDTRDGVAVLMWERGVWSSINAAYSFVPGAIATAVLAWAFARASNLYRGQIGAILLGSIIFWLNGLVSAINTSVFQNLFLILFPLSYTISSIAMLLGIFGFRLLDIVPIARATVIESLDDSVIVLDAQQRIVDLNRAAQRMFGWSATQALGKPATTVLREWPTLIDLCCEAVMVRTEWTTDAQRVYDVRATPLKDTRGNALGQVLIFHDITERKRAQAESLQHQRARAMVEERERLAREMHDGLAQVLAYLNVQTQAVRELLARGNTRDADAHLVRLADIARDTHADARDYIFGAKTAFAPEQGLLAALEKYLARFSENYHIATELCVPHALEPGALALETEVQLLRIIQESLNNVRKHSRAQAARVSILKHLDQVEIAIEDNGVGFDPAQAAPNEWQHFGTRIMRERADEIGARLAVDAAPGRGTRVSIRLPTQAKT
jgi:PAS domain S-box-containing protein